MYLRRFSAITWDPQKVVEHGQEAEPDLWVGDEGGVGGGVLEEPLGGDHGHREALRVGVHHH